MNRFAILVPCLLGLAACDRTPSSGNTLKSGQKDPEKEARVKEERHQENTKRFVRSWRTGEGEKLYHEFAGGYDLKADGTFVAVPDANAGPDQNPGQGRGRW
jgi:hypothetical protein